MKTLELNDTDAALVVRADGMAEVVLPSMAHSEAVAARLLISALVAIVQTIGATALIREFLAAANEDAAAKNPAPTVAYGGSC